MEKYSFLMSLYIKTDTEEFKISIDSILNQTVPCDEIVLVEDGKISDELQNAINEYMEKYPGLFNIVVFEQNQGLGPALNAGVLACKNEIIARLDSDDFTIPTRMEKVLAKFEEDPELGMVGGNVTEFIGEFKNIVSLVVLPETNEEIIKFAKKRNPFRASAWNFKKSLCLKAGNFRTYHLVEDYDMFVRMIRAGGKSYNIQEYLSYMRTGEDFYKRRGGLKYLKSIRKFKKELRTTGFINMRQYLKTVLPHDIVCLMPNFLREFVYKKFLRKKPSQEEIDKIQLSE